MFYTAQCLWGYWCDQGWKYRLVIDTTFFQVRRHNSVTGGAEINLGGVVLHILLLFLSFFFNTLFPPSPLSFSLRPLDCHFFALVYDASSIVRGSLFHFACRRKHQPNAVHCIGGHKSVNR